MQDMFDVITEIIKISPVGHKTLSTEMIINMSEFCIALLRTDSVVITNPYIKAKALEIMAIFH